MKWLFSCLMVLPLYVQAMDLSPWSGTDAEIHVRVTDQLQKRPSHLNNFLGFGVEGSFDVYQVDLELNMASTEKLMFGFNDVRLTGRYRLYDDVIGDPFTLTTGITLIKPTHHSLRDPDLFHHAIFEGEVHAAIGKEWSHLQFWTTRFWGVAVVGAGIKGYPWLRGDIGLDKNWCDAYSVRIFVRTLWGLGHKHLHTHDFHGYGHVQHQSADIGFEYNQKIVWDSTLTIGYAYRPFAYNYPKYVNTLTLQWMLPFGL
jgi:hypothetical protein